MGKKHQIHCRKIQIMLTIIVVLIGCRAEIARAEDRPPNFIIILADDLGYGDLSCYGSRMISTPNLDKLAKEGLRLTCFYASANVCTPSRAGLLTGRYAIRMGLANNVLMPNSTNGLPQDELTIAQALKEKGYATAIVGKWHLGHLPDFWPTKHGFDEFYGLPYSNDMTPLALYRQEEKIEEPVIQETLTERYTGEAIKFIEKNKGKQFFLYLAHNMPHIPIHASEKFRGKSKAGLYGDAVETIDWGVGEIMKKLKELRLDKNTLLIFTSDNGPWYEGSPGPFRTRKGESHEGGMRVPCIVRWPGEIPRHTVSDVMATNLDFKPTILGLAGYKISDAQLQSHPLDGRDIFPLLRSGGKKSEFLADRVFYMFDNESIAGVRQGPWKLVVSTRYRNMNINLRAHNFYKGGMLFDIANDPYETYNVAREHPDVVQHLSELLDKGIKELNPKSLPQPSAKTSE